MTRHLNYRQLKLLAESVAQLGLALLVVTVLLLFVNTAGIGLLAALRGLIMALLAYVISLYLLDHDDHD